MKYSFVIASVLSVVYGHGVVTEVKGANGVTMPGLSGEYCCLQWSRLAIINDSLNTPHSN